MSNGYSLYFYDGGIGSELVKKSSERTKFGFEWYSAGDMVLVDTGSAKEIFTYETDEYGEIRMIMESKDLAFYKH